MDSTRTAAPLRGNVLGTSDGSFVIVEWEAPGASGEPIPIAPMHYHLEDDEAWFVLEGRLCVCVGDEIVEARAGSGAFVPRGVVHAYWNPDPTPARYLLVMPPRIYTLIQAIHASEDRSPQRIKSLFEEHGAVLVL